MQSDGIKIQLEDGSADLVFLVTIFHEVGETEKVLSEFLRILKPAGRLLIMEIVRKSIIPSAPVQNPATVKAGVEASNFILAEMKPYKHYTYSSSGKALLRAFGAICP